MIRIQPFVGITCRVPKLASLLLGVVVVWFAACGPTQTPTPAPVEPLLEKITVFSKGENGYACFRIPALVVSPSGTVLAFAEGRVDRCADDADINLVLKRSTDHGRTWGDLQVLFDDGDLSVNQPTPIVDHETGEVVFVFCKNNQRVFVSKSADDGATWAEPREITGQVTDPSWSYFGAGPGHGIQLSSGRLLVSSWGDLSPGAKTWRPANWGKVQFSYVMYSDDHGETWKRSEPLDVDLSDESMSVETEGGRIYMNMRSRQQKHMRAYSWSEDGGETWSKVEFDNGMPEPSVQGSVVRYTTDDDDGKNRVLLAHPSSQTERAQLTVRMSYDECRTWPVAKLLQPGSSAYSDLAIASDKTVLCLYEADKYSKFILARFNLAWLTDGADNP